MTRVLIAVLFCVLSLPAQVIVKFTPESSAVNISQVANARNLQRYVVEACNQSANPITLSVEQIHLGAPTLSFIDAQDAAMVLNGDVSRTFWGSVVHYASIGGEIVGLVLAVRGGNSQLATGFAIGGALLPGVVQIAKGQLQTSAGLLVSPQYPLTLGPGACFTDHYFTARPYGKAKLAPVEVMITATGAPGVPPTVTSAPIGTMPVQPQVKHDPEPATASWEVKPYRPSVIEVAANGSLNWR